MPGPDAQPNQDEYRAHMIWQDSVELTFRLLIAALGGLAVGIEREWSVKRSKHALHFAGARTFLLLGLLGALGAHLCGVGLIAAGAALLLGSAALIVCAYVITSMRDDPGGTTEVAAFIVLAGGVLAGMHQLTLASGLFAITTLILAEKGFIHAFVERIQSQDLMAAARFAVLALVIFPLLPQGPLGPSPGLRPQELWTFVLIFSGLSFASFVMLRLVGLHRGYGLMGLLGGMVSSTTATLNFSRESRQHPRLSAPLSLGLIAASAVLPVRVIILTAAFSPSLGAHTALYLAGPLLVALAAIGLTLLLNHHQAVDVPTPRNPLRFGAALQMALLFQGVLYLMQWVTGQFGAHGSLTSAAIVGLTDVDPLIYSMVKLGGADATGVSAAARVLTVGVIANSVFKGGLALVIGRGAFRLFSCATLLGMACAGLASLLLL